MKLLALDTATQLCSAALALEGRVATRELEGPQRGSQVLALVDELLAEAGIGLTALDAIAFGRGPGAFTGVRLAAGVTQGLAFAAGLPVLPVSDLRAVALAALGESAAAGAALDRVLVCQDARMAEVYWATYVADARRLARLDGVERVGPPSLAVLQLRPGSTALAGSGLLAYPAAFAAAGAGAMLMLPSAKPHAAAILRLGAADLAAGEGLPPEQALPVYLRDDVATPRNPLT